MRILCLASALLMTSFLADAPSPDAAKRLSGEKEALAPLQTFVGSWRGAGQIKRGSTQGAWAEESDWAWCFTDGHAALMFKSPQGKYFSSGRVIPGDKPKEFVLVGILPDGKTEERYQGAFAEAERLVFKAKTPGEGRPAQISLRQVAGGDRLVVLFEKQIDGTDQFTRLSEVGYTRKGSGFGGGTTFPECVVTGGYANMSVEYKGQTYKICCEGCRDLFQMDPEAVLAEYKERKAKEREKQKNK
jgi:YHS domain-containing protein